jgi:hypothetical protein
MREARQPGGTLAANVAGTAVCDDGIVIDLSAMRAVTGLTTKPFYVDSDDPYKRSNPGVQLSFARSYGDPQPVAVIAKRSLGAVTVQYRINGGAVQSAPTSEWEGGSRYDPASVYYHQMRGVVTGTDPGDSVEVWFEGGGQRSDSFTYQAVSESGNRVLVVAAEDYTGASPVQDPAGPHFVTQYTDALAANGQQADVTTSTPPGGSPRTPSECSATTTRSFGRPETTWSPDPPTAVAAMPTGWHSTNCLSSART